MKLTVMILMGVLLSMAEGASLHPDIEEGMISADREIALEAVAACVGKGVDVLPKLREWATSDDPRLRVRAQLAIGRITGQWGSQTDLVWGRSFEKAKKSGKPILFLQLFGNLDEEFC